MSTSIASLEDHHEESSSLAEEIRELNADVISDYERDENLVASEALARAITSGSRYVSDEENTAAVMRTKSRRDTIVESIKNTAPYQKVTKFSWWDTDFKRQRLKTYSQFLKNYLLLCVVLTIVLCIYWGSYYNRDQRYVNLKILMVNDDQSVNGITPIIGQSVQETAKLPAIARLGGWKIYSHEEFAPIAAKHNNTITQEIYRQVHHQNYWGAIYVNENVTYQFHEAIESGNQNFNVSDMVHYVYETGRDLITMNQYVTPHVRLFEKAYFQVVGNNLPTFVEELSNSTVQAQALTYLSQPFVFSYDDVVPVTQAVLLAPLQLGLTFLIVFAFFSMIMTIRIQIYLSTIVTGFRYVLLRLLISHISYIVLSLGYVIVNVAFKISLTHTFGKSGGLVLWAFSYLTMASLGSLNEVVALLCFTYQPILIGGWLVLLMALNVAPSVSAMALTNHFYRYGYAIPIHNSYEAVKVVFNDIYKGQLGRNIGILVAWIVLSNLSLPFVMIHVAKVMARRKEKEEKREKEEKQMELQKFASSSDTS